MTEMRRMAAIRSNPGEFIKAMPALLRNAWNRISGASHMATGTALIGWLRLGMKQQQILVVLLATSVVETHFLPRQTV